MEQYLLRNHETRKYLQEQAYRLQQGLVATTTQQLVDRMCVQVQDHLNSLRFSEDQEVQKDMRSAQDLMKDARSCKTLLPNLYHLPGPGTRGPCVGAIQDTLVSMSGEVSRVIDQQLKVLLSSMVDRAKSVCPHVMRRSSLREKLEEACVGRMVVPRSFVSTALLEQSGVDIINKISEVKLSLASLLSDRIMNPCSKRKSILVRMLRPVSVAFEEERTKEPLPAPLPAPRLKRARSEQEREAANNSLKGAESPVDLELLGDQAVFDWPEEAVSGRGKQWSSLKTSSPPAGDQHHQRTKSLPNQGLTSPPGPGPEDQRPEKSEEDSDKGYIEDSELDSLLQYALKVLGNKGFLQDLFLQHRRSITAGKLEEYTITMENDLLSHKQYGFISGRSTPLQLLKVLDNWTDIIDRGGQIDCIFCDFMKAFDKMKIFDRDGQLDLNDLARILSLKENFLLKFKMNACSLEGRKRDFEKIFAHYDVPSLGGAELESFRTALLGHCDLNQDGKIQKNELALCLGLKLYHVVLMEEVMELGVLFQTLIGDMKDQMEDWKRNTHTLDKEHAKECKKARQQIKKKSSDSVRLQKKVKKADMFGRGDLQPQLDSAMQDVSEKYFLLEEVEEQALRRALVEERSHFCSFASMLRPVLEEEMLMLGEIGGLGSLNDDIRALTMDPHKLPPSSEQVIVDLKGSEVTWSNQTPPSSPGTTVSRKSSMCRCVCQDWCRPASYDRWSRTTDPSSHLAGDVMTVGEEPARARVTRTKEEREVHEELSRALSRGLHLDLQGPGGGSLQGSSGYSSQTPTPAEEHTHTPGSDPEFFSMATDQEVHKERSSSGSQSARRGFHPKRPAAGSCAAPLGVATIRRAPSTKPSLRRPPGAPGPFRPPMIPVKTPTVPDRPLGSPDRPLGSPDPPPQQGPHGPRGPER
ncbi:hypothetical protein NHX12_023231, partial [Muraenolepis orangiensis]